MPSLVLPYLRLRSLGVRCSTAGSRREFALTVRVVLPRWPSFTVGCRQVRSCVLAIHLADLRSTFEAQFPSLQAALRSMEEKPIDFNYTDSKGHTLLMVIVAWWKR